MTQAEETLRQAKIVSAPIAVERVAKHLGAEVRFSPLDDELSGMIYIKNNVPIIGVNSLHHPNRQRFTIAHEIGHLVMHRSHLSDQVHVDKQFRVLMRDVNSTTGTDSIEVQANQFASHLLIPARILDEYLAGKPFDIDDDGPLEDLAKKVRVSKQTLAYRIRNA